MKRLAPGPIRHSGILTISVTIALLVVPSVPAQTTLGAVSGTVRDQSAAVIPNATVELTNTATNVLAKTTTNDHPGNPNSVGGNGMLSTRSSGNSPRTLQLSVRLTF